MHEGARLATISDADAIVKIRDDQLETIVDERGGNLFVHREMGNTPVDLRLKAALADEDKFVVVGTYGDVVFGYGWVSIVTLDDGSLLGQAVEFVVDAKIRKTGIGEAMMDLIIEKLTKRGCIGVDSFALPGDRNTKNFFESFGLKARMLTVHRSF